MRRGERKVVPQPPASNRNIRNRGRPRLTFFPSYMKRKSRSLPLVPVDLRNHDANCFILFFLFPLCRHPLSLNPGWPCPAALVPLTLHGDGLKALRPAKLYYVNKGARLVGERVDYVFGWANGWACFLAGAWVGVGGCHLR